MANSLEVRTPWLDKDVIEHAYGQIPPEWKCTFGERRRIQNLMARRYLPKSFVHNRKQGFSVPMDGWMRQTDLSMYFNHLPDGLFDKKEIDRLVAGQRKGRTNGARLFALVMLSLANPKN